MRVYLIHPISTTGEFVDSKRVANNLRDMGFEVYAAAENKAINDKESNDPTPVDIYEGDIDRLVNSDIIIANLTGGDADGSVCEVGVIGGYNISNSGEHLPIIGYTSNKRAKDPQFFKNVASSKLNHLVLGVIEKNGKFVGGEDNMYEYMKQYLRD